MSRRNPKRDALRLPLSTSPVARRAQASPVHSIPPRFLDEDDASSADDEVDTNLEEDLLMEVRSTSHVTDGDLHVHLRRLVTSFMCCS
jgi:hypothetical protein